MRPAISSVLNPVRDARAEVVRCVGLVTDAAAAAPAPARHWATFLGVMVLLAVVVLQPVYPVSAAIGDIDTVAGGGSAGAPDYGDGGLATDATLARPAAAAVDGQGNLYIADLDHHRVRRVDADTKVITTIAGTGVAGYNGDNQPATAAQLNEPSDVAVDGADNVYVADWENNRVRKIDSSGVITTVAGDGSTEVLDGPVGIALDGAGSLYVAEIGGHRVSKVDLGTQTITLFAGNTHPGNGQKQGYAGDGGPAVGKDVKLNEPADAAVGDNGNVYIADSGNHVIRVVDTSGIIDTYAGTGTRGYSGDGGQATSAQMDTPVGVAVDYEGNLFIAEYSNHVIRKVVPGGTISTVAGDGTAGFSGDGGPATAAQLAAPARVDLAANGDFYIGDTFNNRVRRVDALGVPDGVILEGTTPVSPANDNAPLVYGSAEAGTTVDLYPTADCSGSTIGSGTASELASPGIPISVGDDTTTDIYATATDSSGTTSACSVDSITYVEDSTGPDAPTITDSPQSPGDDTTPSWSFTGAESGGSFECKLVEVATNDPVEDWTACTSPKSYDLSAYTDGDYTFSVRQYDDAGNAGTTASDTYTLDSTADDTTAPAAPTIDQAPDPDPGNTADVTWEFTPAESGGSVTCQLKDGAGNVIDGPTTPCASPAGYTLPGEGEYTFEVWQTDDAGNVGAAASDTHTLDTTAPAAPTIDTAPSPDPGTATTVEWAFSGAESGGSFECQLTHDTTVLAPWQACASPASYTLSDGDGVYTFEVRQVDEAGNAGDAAGESYTLDTTAPGAPTITAEPSPDPSNSTDVSWEFSAAEPGGTFACKLTGPTGIQQDWTASGCAPGTPVSYSLAQGDGTYTFEVRQTDDVGNTGDAAGESYTLDTAEPATPNVTGPDPDPGNATDVQWSFTGIESGTTVTCRLLYGGGVVTTVADCTSPQTFSLSQGDGDYTFEVTQTDDAGNTSQVGAETYTLDTTVVPPSVTGPDSPGNDTTVSWSFSGETGASFECRLTSPSGAGSWTACSSPASYTLSEDGTHTLSVIQTDAAGNESDPASADYELDTTGPTAPDITAEPAPDPGNETDVTWEFNAQESGGTMRCRLSHDGVVLTGDGSGDGFEACTSDSTAVHTLDQGDGVYTFEVRQVDAAGNLGTVASDTHTLDSTGPGAPTIDRAPDPDPGQATSVQWEFTGAEPDGTFGCQLSHDGSVVTAFTDCTSPAAYELAQGDGTYTFAVTQTDDVGNTSPAATETYTLQSDVTAPDAPTITGFPEPDPGESTDVSWEFTGTEPGGSFVCRLSHDGTVVEPFAPCTSPVDYQLSDGDGAYTFEVRHSDDAGNTSTAASETFTLDTPDPQPDPTPTPDPEPTATPTPTPTPTPSPTPSPTPTTSPSPTPTPTPSPTPTETESPTPDPTPEPSPTLNPDPTPTETESPTPAPTTDPSPTPRSPVPAPSSPSPTPSEPTPSPTSTAPSAPAAPRLLSVPDSPGTDTSPGWSFTTEGGTTAECRLTRGVEIVEDWQPCREGYTHDLDGQQASVYSLFVRAVDDDGNTSAVVRSDYELTGAAVGDPQPAPAPSQPPAVTVDGQDPVPAGLLPPSDGGSDDGDTTPPPPWDEQAEASQPPAAPPTINLSSRNLAQFGATALQNSAFPIVLLLIVLAFLIIQHHIDRSDPKLAEAPVYADPDLPFTTPPTSPEDVA